MNTLTSFLCRSTLRSSVSALRYSKATLGSSFPKNTPLSPKRGNKEYYKGNGCRPVGRHTEHGRYIVEERKVMVLDVPDLTNFKLKPYVAYSTPKVK